MNIKRIISAFLLIAFSFGAIFTVGCSDADESVSDSSVTSETSVEASVEESKAPEPIKLRIGSYNIANGRDVNWDFKHIANDIIEKDLDIVGLQEVDILCQRSKFSDTMELLKEYTGLQYYAYFKCIDLPGDVSKYGKTGAYGTAILSKYPIKESSDIELNDGTKVERRVLGCAKIDVNGTEINFFNTHLTFSSLPIRSAEFELIANTVKNANNCILTGDFNVDSYSEFEVLKPLSYVNNPETNIVTFPDGNLKIDNICYSSEFTLVDGSVGTYQKNHSDHLLLYAELEIMPAE